MRSFIYTVLQILRNCVVQIKEDERDGHVARIEQLRSVLDF